MRSERWIQMLMLFVTGLVLSVSFNNCGQGTSYSGSGGGLNLSSNSLNPADFCSETDLDFYDKGYHQFLEVQCKNCHINGPGIGTFASPDLATSFAGFNMHGYDKISNYAVDDNHHPPYTGSGNTTIVNQLRTQWQSYQTAKLSCGGVTATPTPSTVYVAQFGTSTQTIPAIGNTVQTIGSGGSKAQITVYDRKTLTWDLGKSLAALGSKAVPNLAGVSISVVVTGFVTQSGETAYLFTLPTLTVGANSVELKGLNIKLNGFPVFYATTFSTLDATVYQNTSKLISPGSLVSVGPVGGANDTLSLEFADISLVNIPAPPPPASVQFAIGSMTVQKSQLGYANEVTFQVQVTGSNPNPIAVPVNVVSNANYLTGENPAVPVLGASGMNQFNWDYKVDPNSTLSLTLAANQTSASFKIIFSDDLRFDVTKTLRLQLGTPLGAALGTNSMLVITIPNYNPQYTGSAPTFAQLMDPQVGVLGVNCVHCHNSVQLQGGYDMTDYQNMVALGIIKPGDLVGNDSLMYRRMNADAPQNQGLQSMPLDGFLSPDLVYLVNQWIQAGAQNN